MIAMTRPRAFVPLHGTLHHLLRHAELATKLGVPEVCVLENGQSGELSQTELRKGARFHAGRVHVFARRVLAPSILQEREALAAHGAAHVTVPIDPRGQIAGEIVVVTRGVVDEVVDAHVLAAARDGARAAIEDSLVARPEQGRVVDEAAVAEAARGGVRRALGRLLGFKPVTSVTVLRVAG
jgi:ribonuclease J